MTESFYAVFKPDTVNVPALLGSYDAIHVQHITVIMKPNGLYFEALAFNHINMTQSYIPATSFETYDFRPGPKKLKFMRIHLDRQQLIGAMNLKSATLISLRYRCSKRDRCSGKKTADKPNALYINCTTNTEQETDWACFEFESAEDERGLEDGLRIVDLPTELLQVHLTLKEAIESLTNFLKRDEDAVRIDIQQERKALYFETDVGTSWINIVTNSKTKLPLKELHFKYSTKTFLDMLSAFGKICELTRLSIYDHGLLALVITDTTGVKSVFFLPAKLDLFD